MAEVVTIDGAAVQQIDETLAQLATATTNGGELNLCFDNHWAEGGHQPALLGAALMGTFANRKLVVDVVDDDAVERLLRFGVAAALWRRPAGLTQFSPDAVLLDRPHLGAVWTVGSRATTDALFGPDDEAALEMIGPRHATFVNPHLSSGEDGLPDIVYLVARWLTRRAPEAPSVVDAVTNSLGELVANVQEHAGGATAKSVNSLVRVAIDEHAVRCSVLDTGIGIPESIGPKVDAPADPTHLLAQLLAGELDRWSHGRGIGLERVVKLVHSHGGEVNVATRLSRVRAGGDADIEGQTSRFDLEGTVVDLAVPLPTAPA